MRDFQAIEFWKQDGAAWIRFNRPRVLNAMSTAAYAEVRDAIRLADYDDDVDVTVLTGAGQAFATGGDLREAAGYLESGELLKMHAFDDNSPFVAMRKSSKALVASVNGACVAGGLIMAALCDVIIAARGATFAVPEARVGLADPFIVTVLAPRISMSKLRYLILTGATITADEAEAFGLVTETVDDHRLEKRTAEVVAELRQTDRRARAAYRRHFNDAMPPFDFTKLDDDYASWDLSRLHDFSGSPRHSEGAA